MFTFVHNTFPFISFKDVKKVLGSGEYGIVTMGTVKGHGKVAAKTVRVRSDSDLSFLRSLLSELKIMVRQSIENKIKSFEHEKIFLLRHKFIDV